MPIVRENIVPCFHYRVARVSAPGVVPLRRLAGCCAGLKRIRGSVIVEHAVSPSAAFSESLAVFHHEVDVMLDTWHACRGEQLLFFGVQWIFAILTD